MFWIKAWRQTSLTRLRREIARETRSTMLSYHAARRSLDVYEMRLDAIDTRLGKRVRELEARVAELEAADAAPAEPARLSGPRRVAV
ncbi:MAG: hypothetical protein AAF360_07060 [Pseudomonadota bacterium]